MMVVITAMNKSTQLRGCLAKFLQSAAMRRRISTSRTMVITVSVVSIGKKPVSGYTRTPSRVSTYEAARRIA